MLRIPAPARLPLLDASLAVGLPAAAALVAFRPEYAEKMRNQFDTLDAYHGALLVWWLLTALIAAGLLLQHRWPLPAFAFVVLGAAGHEFDARISAPLIDYAVPIVLYTLASLARRRWVPVVGLVVAVLTQYWISLFGQQYPFASKPAYVDRVAVGAVPAGKLVAPARLTREVLFGGADKSVQLLLLLVLAVALGEVARARRARLVAVEQRAADLEREQQQRAALAMAAERARITRELHDVVAHGLSVMVVQAQGAAAALRRHPERAEAALQEVITVGRGSLAEMRRLLGVVRRDPAEDAGAPELAPQPGIAVLPALVDQVRAAGTPVRLVVRGEPVALPAGVDLSAYRIVQEALTNALKHAGPGASVTVEVTFAADRLGILVTDDGTGPAHPVGANGGTGLRGIAERVAVLGGTLAAGAGADRGFRVEVALPLTGEPAPAAALVADATLVPDGITG
jgi:signal transduction histidine kinase